MTAPVYASEGEGVAKEDLKVGIIYIGDENEGYSAAHMAGIDEMVETLGLEESQVIEKTLISETRRVMTRQRTWQTRDASRIPQTALAMKLILLRQQASTRRFSSAMQQELRQRQAALRTCTTISQIFMNPAMYSAWLQV